MATPDGRRPARAQGGWPSGRGLRRILVASDLRPGSAALLDAAVALAIAFDASIDIAYVQDPLAALLSGGPAPDSSTSAAELRATREARVDRSLAAQANRIRRRGITCVTTALEGRPAARLYAHLKKTGAGLVVAGLVTERRLGHLLVGRLGARIAQRAPCPVLLVPV
jgi:nucleotide-binding universal stress UspA family protein